MSYTGFDLSIESPHLKQIARWWHAGCGAHKLPSWNDLRLSEINRLMPILWTFDFDRASERFVGRWAGANIEQLFGKRFAETAMEDLYPPRDYPHLYERARRVIEGPELYHGVGMVFRHLNRTSSGERIILPVAEDGEHGDGILGATVYQFLLIDRTDVVPENENWYAV